MISQRLPLRLGDGSGVEGVDAARKAVWSWHLPCELLTAYLPFF